MSARDAQWLAQEDPNQPMHGGLILHYAGHMTRDQLLQLITERLPLLPRLRQKMVFAPFGTATPSWEDDPAFDIRNHVKELTLPQPADERVLAAAVGGVHAQHIDRTRPVWEATLLHGRPDGTTVLYFKIHHSAVDGPGMMELLPLLHDAEPGASLSPPLSNGNGHHTSPGFEVYDAVHDRIAELFELGTRVAAGMQPTALAQQTRQLSGAVASLAPELLKPQRRMPWNGELGPERRVAWTEVPFEEVRGLGKKLGGTINDVAMTIMAGGLARYLRHHAYATAGLELRDMVTVSVRRPEERGALGNRVTAVFAPLYVGIDDPLERFAAERAAMNRVKELGLAEVFDSLSQFSTLIPPIVWQLASQPRPQLPRLPIKVPQPTIVSVISSNVVGPQQPLRLAGHELVRWQSAGICMMNVGLFVVMQSYSGTFSFSVTVDPALVPDEWVLIEHFREALDELRQAASGRPAGTRAARGKKG
jgi:WS/DGAT/MGAT family acyltransferase